MRQRVVFLDYTLNLPRNLSVPFDDIFPNQAPSHRSNTGKSYTHQCGLQLMEGTETCGTEDVMSFWGILGVTPYIATGHETSDSLSHLSTHPDPSYIQRTSV